MSKRLINPHYESPVTAVIRENTQDNSVLSPLRLGKIKERLMIATEISSRQVYAPNHADVGLIEDDPRIEELSNGRTWDSVAVLLGLTYSHRRESPNTRLLEVSSDE